MPIFGAMSSLSNTSHFWARLRHNKGAVFGLCIIFLSFFIAVFAYVIAPDNTPNANQMTVEIGGKKPGFTLQFLRLPASSQQIPVSFLQQMVSGRPSQFTWLPIAGYFKKAGSIVVQKYIDEGITETQTYPLADGQGVVVTKTFLLGTDRFGRDILDRLVVGTRVSLMVGCIAVIISLALGILLGAIAGYFGGWTDDIIMWFINVIWSIPTLLLVFALTLLLGKGFWQVFIAVGLTMWVNVARLVRGQVMAVRELEYIEATQGLGLLTYPHHCFSYSA